MHRVIKLQTIIFTSYLPFSHIEERAKSTSTKLLQRSGTVQCGCSSNSMAHDSGPVVPCSTGCRLQNLCNIADCNILVDSCVLLCVDLLGKKIDDLQFDALYMYF
jgi:hypothetical protein